MERAGRHRRHLLARARPARARRVLRRRGGVAPRRSIRPPSARSTRPTSSTVLAARPRRRGAGTLVGLPAARRRWSCWTTRRCSRRRPTTRRPAAARRAARRVPAARAAAPARRGRRGRGSRMGTRSVGGFRGQFKTLADEIRSWRLEGFTVRLVVDDDAAGRAPRARSWPSTSSRPGPMPTLWSGEGLGVLVGECAAGFQLPALGLIVLGEQEIFGARRRRLRRPAVPARRGHRLVHRPRPERPGRARVRTASGATTACATLAVEGRDADFLLLEYGEGGPALPARRPARPDLQVHGRARGRGPPRPARRGRLAARQGVGAGRPPGDGGGPAAAVRRALGGRARRLLGDTPLAARVRGRLPLRGDAGPAPRHRGGQGRHGAAPGRWTAWWPATSATARPRSRCAPRSRRWPTAGRSRCWCRPPCSPSSTGTRSPSASARSRRGSSCSRASGARRSSKAVVGGLASGTVDVVIGTHRLLSKDVAFKDLGPAGGGRGAPLRRHPQGADQAAPGRGGRAHADRHADPAHAAHGDVRRARPLA